MTSSSAPETGVTGGRAGTAVCLLAALSVISATFSVAVSSIAMGSAFVALAVVITRNGISSVPKSGLEAAFLLYIAAEIVSSAFSVDPADSFTNMKRVLLIGVVYITAFSFRSEKRIAAVLVLLGALGAATVIAEVAALRVVNGAIERPGMFQMPMTEGGIRMLIILVLIPFALSTALSLRWRLGLAAALAVLIAGLAISQTRSAWVAFVAGALVIGLLRDRRVLAGLALLVVLFALFAPAEIRDRATSIVELSDRGGFVADSVTTNAESNVSRFQMIATGWRMFLDRPIVRVGRHRVAQLLYDLRDADDAGGGGTPPQQSHGGPGDARGSRFLRRALPFRDDVRRHPPRRAGRGERVVPRGPLDGHHGGVRRVPRPGSLRV